MKVSGEEQNGKNKLHARGERERETGKGGRDCTERHPGWRRKHRMWDICRPPQPKVLLVRLGPDLCTASEPAEKEKVLE